VAAASAPKKICKIQFGTLDTEVSCANFDCIHRVEALRHPVCVSLDVLWSRGSAVLFVDEMELLKVLILPFAFTQEIQKVEELQVSSRMMFEMPARTAAPYGCMDARLGISDKVSTCKTCQ
jgi:hypothetical protein